MDGGGRSAATIQPWERRETTSLRLRGGEGVEVGRGKWQVLTAERVRSPVYVS